MPGHKNGISEAKSRGEPEERDGQKKDLPQREWVDAD